jgi:hypothetical protein
MWALLTVYQVLRTAMVSATDSVPGTDPDRASFTVALHTAREQLTNAANVLTETIDLVGHIGRQILAQLLPARRLRVHTGSQTITWPRAMQTVGRVGRS